ncbi:hypothetical protein PYCCODRAFT_352984 [Trametes coccinea BRFM310]|uniref:Uncharacterized protein n=1 Tax=Trametes coccinea (strain BRFM310) TaxID=1353009 RepID=A0A1Y2J334_TRAC3|nr:hypothetical protein PYCCODRAFT_352984 [Trametes coccinea BRFM310]
MVVRYYLHILIHASTIEKRREQRLHHGPDALVCARTHLTGPASGHDGARHHAPPAKVCLIRARCIYCPTACLDCEFNPCHDVSIPLPRDQVANLRPHLRFSNNRNPLFLLTRPGRCSARHLRHSVPSAGLLRAAIVVVAICSDCAWTRYCRYLERLGHISAVPRRPPFVIPLYRLVRDSISGAEQWYLAGIAHSPTNSIHSKERTGCVREGVADHLRHRWTARPLPPFELT